MKNSQEKDALNSRQKQGFSTRPAETQYERQVSNYYTTVVGGKEMPCDQFGRVRWPDSK